jgi:hypothetical protein
MELAWRAAASQRCQLRVNLPVGESQQALRLLLVLPFWQVELQTLQADDSNGLITHRCQGWDRGRRGWAEVAPSAEDEGITEGRSVLAWTPIQLLQSVSCCWCIATFGATVRACHQTRVSPTDVSQPSHVVSPNSTQTKGNHEYALMHPGHLNPVLPAPRWRHYR